MSNITLISLIEAVMSNHRLSSAEIVVTIMALIHNLDSVEDLEEVEEFLRKELNYEKSSV